MADLKKHNIKYIVKAGIIAAMYVGLTFAFYGLSFEAVQFRISEVLVALVFFEPAAFPGVCLGCFIANILGPEGFYDGIFGTLASAIGIQLLRVYCIRFKHKGNAAVGLLLYALVNSILVAIELSFGSGADSGQSILWIFLWVMLGESVTAVGGGSGLYYVLRKRWKDIIGETEKSKKQR